MRYIPVFLLLVCSLPAHAGSQSRDCQTEDQSIVMGAGNSTNRVQIKTVDKGGRSGIYDVPVKIKPEFDYNTEESDQTITAIPVAPEKILRRRHQVMHVVHRNGSSCDGRERWDDQSRQTYVLTGKDGSPLDVYGALLDLQGKGMTPDGYLVADFQCRSYGITSPGGCFAADGDQVTWVNQK